MRSNHATRLIIAFSIFLLGLSCGCSRPGGKIVDHVVVSPTPTTRPTVLPTEMRLREEAMRSELKRQAQWFRLPNLEEVSLGAGHSETRICAGFDGAETPCLVLSSDGSTTHAILLEAKFTRTDAKVTAAPVQKQLQAPHSGWPALDSYLKEHGVTNPLRFSFDNEHVIDPDQGTIVIEIKTGSAYSMVFFPFGTQTEDGKRAFQICQKLEQEFDVGLRCGSKSK